MALETSSLPRHGTALAATGWFDEQRDGLFMALFYLGLNDDLVHDTFECDLSTGRYVLRESEKVLDGRTGGMHADTRLSVVSRDKGESYQLFYPDETGAVVRIAYTRTQGWHSKDTVVDSSVAGALSAYWHDTGNISVATLRDSTSFRISEITAASTTWQHYSVPISAPQDYGSAGLTNWTSESTGLCLAAREGGSWSLFYTGGDARLHGITADVVAGDSALDPRENESVWPLAKTPNAPLAIATHSDFKTLWIYYFTDKGLVQVYRNASQQWQPASVILSATPAQPVQGRPPAVGTGLPGTSGPSTPSSSSSRPGATSSTAEPSRSSTAEQDECGPGCSHDARTTGIAVGVAMGVAALAMMATAWWLLRRWRRKQAGIDEAAREEREYVPYHLRPEWAHIQPYSQFGNLTWTPEQPGGEWKAEHKEHASASAGGT